MTREVPIRFVDSKDARWRDAVCEKGILKGNLNEVSVGQAHIQRLLSQMLASLAEQHGLLAWK